MAKTTTDSFILELKLSTEVWQRDILQKRFELARKLYNTTLFHALKQLNLMKQSKNYRKHLSYLRKAKSKLKQTSDKQIKQMYQAEISQLTKTLNSIRKSNGLTEFDLHAYIKKHQHNVKKHIDSLTAQKVATAVWSAIEDVLFKGRKAHFKKIGTLTSVEGKTNTSGIRIKNQRLLWNGLNLPVVIRKNDLFVEESLALHQVKYCRLLKKIIRGKDTYYVQLIMDGIPPRKRVNATGAFRHQVSSSKRVGVDIGTSTVAVASETEVFIQALAPKVPQFDNEKRRLLRKLERSRRSTNPDNFHPDGTIKRGLKLTWYHSNNYIKIQGKLHELYRKRTVYVKEQHAILANRLLELGDEVYVETMPFSALAKRTKETKINKQGKFQRKKRFGKSIGSYAPAMLITIIHRKLGYTKKSIRKVNTRTFKASQYNHVTDSYQKKKLSQRWTLVSNQIVQRDLYSAFLLMNSEVNLQQTNQVLCKQTFENFLKLHDQHIKTLRQCNEKLPSSIGIKQIS